MRHYLLILLLLAAAKANGQCEQPLLLAYTGDWYPYLYETNQGYTGRDFQLLRSTLENMGCNLAVIEIPTKRVKLELNKGTFDVSLAASYTPQRANEFWYSEPYRQEYIGLAYIADNGVEPTMSFAQIIKQGHVVSLNTSGWFGEAVADLRSNSSPRQWVHSEKLSRRLKLLAQGKVTVIVDDIQAICAAQQGELIQNLAVHPEVLNINPVHFIFSKITRKPAFVNAFNRALQPLGKPPSMGC